VAIGAPIVGPNAPSLVLLRSLPEVV